MAIVFYASSKRGRDDFGWLQRRMTFNFGDFQNSDCNNFGVLRVFNEDVIAPGRGIAIHSHENMEIITLPLAGSLKVQDSRGNMNIVETGDVHIMSAGKGIAHTEFNHSSAHALHFLQIWILPKAMDLPPRYEQQRIVDAANNTTLILLVAPSFADGLVNINQDAFVSMLNLTEGDCFTYQKYRADNGLFLFLVTGSLIVKGIELLPGDALGITGEPRVNIKAIKNSAVLCIEVPMHDCRQR